MRRLYKQGRLSFATFPEIHFALYAEAHRVAQELGWTILNEKGQHRKPNGAYILNCLLCDALEQVTSQRNEALERGRASLERRADSDKEIPFGLTGIGTPSADAPVAPRVKGVRGRVLSKDVHPRQDGRQRPNAKPIVDDGKPRGS